MPDVNGYISGREGYTNVDGVPFPFGEWSLDMTGSDTPDVTNWLTTPFPYAVPGIHRATLRLAGPYKFASMPLTNLRSYLFSLGFFPGVYLQGIFLVKLKIDNKVTGDPRVEVQGTPQGPFGIALV